VKAARDAPIQAESDVEEMLKSFRDSFAKPRKENVGAGAPPPPPPSPPKAKPSASPSSSSSDSGSGGGKWSDLKKGAEKKSSDADAGPSKNNVVTPPKPSSTPARPKMEDQSFAARYHTPPAAAPKKPEAPKPPAPPSSPPPAKKGPSRFADLKSGADGKEMNAVERMKAQKATAVADAPKKEEKAASGGGGDKFSQMIASRSR
jgi:hypothetical protein